MDNIKDSINNYNVPDWMKEIYKDESKEAKYVPTEIHCVWVVDNDDKRVEFVGQIPRNLKEEDLALEDWVYAERDYMDGRPSQRIYSVRIGTIEEYFLQLLVSKIGKSSFKIAGLDVY